MDDRLPRGERARSGGLLGREGCEERRVVTLIREQGAGNDEMDGCAERWALRSGGLLGQGMSSEDKPYVGGEKIVQGMG